MAIVRGERPPRPEKMTNDGLWQLIERCWSAKPQDRPTFEDVLADVNSLLTDLARRQWNEKNKQIQFENQFFDKLNQFYWTNKKKAD